MTEQGGAWVERGLGQRAALIGVQLHVGPYSSQVSGPYGSDYPSSPLALLQDRAGGSSLRGAVPAALWAVPFGRQASHGSNEWAGMTQARKRPDFNPSRQGIG